jgi:F0F1-type ATP synthase epsilon subunit
MKDLLSLKLFTVDHQIPVTKCDSIRLPIADKLNGEFSGYYGIRKGHTKAVFSLAEGEVIATLNDEAVFSAHISNGFAIVENNEVNVTVDKIVEK